MAGDATVYTYAKSMTTLPTKSSAADSSEVAVTPDPQVACRVCRDIAGSEFARNRSPGGPAASANAKIREPLVTRKLRTLITFCHPYPAVDRSFLTCVPDSSGRRSPATALRATARAAEPLLPIK